MGADATTPPPNRGPNLPRDDVTASVLGPCRIPQPAPTVPPSDAAWPWDPLGRTNCPEQPAQPGVTASSVLLRPPLSAYVLGLCWVLLWAPRQSTFDRARPPGASHDAPGLSGPNRYPLPLPCLTITTHAPCMRALPVPYTGCSRSLTEVSGGFRIEFDLHEMLCAGVLDEHGLGVHGQRARR